MFEIIMDEVRKSVLELKGQVELRIAVILSIFENLVDPWVIGGVNDVKIKIGRITWYCVDRERLIDIIKAGC